MSKAFSNKAVVVRDLFTLDAATQVYQYSEGIPRLINIICDNALLTAYAHDTKTITPDIVMDAVKDNSIFEKNKGIGKIVHNI